MSDTGSPTEAQLREFRLRQALQKLYLGQRPSHSVPAGAVGELHDFAAATIGNEPLLYLEFGVFNGRSIKRMAERFLHPDARFVGFDSFEGLPARWKEMPGGTFSTRGRTPVVNDSRISFVKGWFQNTLPSFLLSLNKAANKPVLVHYDADLYSSTLFVLSTLWQHIPQYYFIFDEFMSEEILALHDFALAFPIEIGFLSQTNAGGCPTQIFGHMRRTEFKPEAERQPVGQQAPRER